LSKKIAGVAGTLAAKMVAAMVVSTPARLEIDEAPMLLELRMTVLPLRAIPPFRRGNAIHYSRRFEEATDKLTLAVAK
jgi:hypothetical protein